MLSLSINDPRPKLPKPFKCSNCGKNKKIKWCGFKVNKENYLNYSWKCDKCYFSK